MLLDEDVPEPLAAFLSGYEVHSVKSMCWASTKNGQLLRLAETSDFQVFITGDKNMENQQSFAGRRFATLVLSTIHWPTLKGNIDKIVRALQVAQIGVVSKVDCGRFRPPKTQLIAQINYLANGIGGRAGTRTPGLFRVKEAL